MKTDYSAEIRKLLASNYDVVLSVNDDSDYTLKKTLSDIHKEVTNILPSRWVEESDIYEALLDLGFKSFLYNIPAEFNKEGDVVVEEQNIFYYLLDKKTAAI